eukprot:Hpha_TRINITY_DN15055_c3_g1::TRINITY_DN15055_c3_g1_i1::g.126214::m.126214
MQPAVGVPVASAPPPQGAQYGGSGGYQQQWQAHPQQPSPQQQQWQGEMYAQPSPQGLWQQEGGTQGVAPVAYAVGVPIYKDVPPPEGKFIQQGCKDAWAAILFVLQFAAVVAVGVIHAVKDGINPDDSIAPSDAPTDETKLSANVWVWGALACVIAGGTGLAALVVLRVAAYRFIVASNVAMAALMLVFSVMLLSKGASGGAIIFFAFAVFNIIWLYIVRHRMHFAGVMLEACAGVVWKYPVTVVVAIMSIIVIIGFILMWVFAIRSWVPEQVERADGTTGFEGGQPGLTVLFLLFLFWSVNTGRGVAHVTVSGTVATWYFMQNNMPKNPTAASLKRSLTTSFGSIAFGSLVVAVVQTIRVIVQSGRDHNNAFVQCCVECILRCIEDLIRYFNKYAFTQVAIYGKGYIEAAKATWALIKAGRGLEALINDCLIDPALTICVLFGALNTGLICGLVSGSVSVGVVCGVVGVGILSTMMSVIDSAVATVFVCYAEAPGALALANPGLYSEMEQASTRW